jgi:hypothetical protein
MRQFQQHAENGLDWPWKTTESLEKTHLDMVIHAFITYLLNATQNCASNSVPVTFASDGIG